MSKVIIFPTDTVYGIGTPIFDIEGIKEFMKLKKGQRISLWLVYVQI